jgi:hypothetical protein
MFVFVALFVAIGSTLNRKVRRVFLARISRMTRMFRLNRKGAKDAKRVFWLGHFDPGGGI